jgi:hypothetical protein
MQKIKTIEKDLDPLQASLRKWQPWVIHSPVQEVTEKLKTLFIITLLLWSLWGNFELSTPTWFCFVCLQETCFDMCTRKYHFSQSLGAVDCTPYYASIQYTPHYACSLYDFGNSWPTGHLERITAWVLSLHRRHIILCIQRDYSIGAPMLHWADPWARRAAS